MRRYWSPHPPTAQIAASTHARPCRVARQACRATRPRRSRRRRPAGPPRTRRRRRRGRSPSPRAGRRRAARRRRRRTLWTRWRRRRRRRRWASRTRSCLPGCALCCFNYWRPLQRCVQCTWRVSHDALRGMMQYYHRLLVISTQIVRILINHLLHSLGEEKSVFLLLRSMCVYVCRVVL